MSGARDDDGNYTFDIYTCHDSQTKVTTNGPLSLLTTRKREDLTLTFPEGTANAWQYIEDTAISNDPAVLWPAAVSTRAGSGTGVKAGFYVSPAASGVRAAWRCCLLFTAAMRLWRRRPRTAGSVPRTGTAALACLTLLGKAG